MGEEKLFCKSVKVGARGQVVLPVELRQKLGIKPGDTLLVCKKGCCVKLLKAEVVEKTLERLVK